MDRQFLQLQITQIESKRYKLEWLTPYLNRAERIANFGCDLGGETIALTWLFQAHEAIGLDIEPEDIRQALDRLEELRKGITQAHRDMAYPWVSEDDRSWWSEVPAFFTQHIVANDFVLEYRESDITKPTGLTDNYYDLAFCDFVLHHIWYDESREDVENDAQFAANEMARIVKPGGIVAAGELIQFDDRPRLDFTRLFERAGLERVHVQEYENPIYKGWVGRYAYKKKQRQEIN